MKTTIGKVLAVVAVAASLAFLGATVVATVGGPNWEGMAREVEGYTFTQSEGQDPQWSAVKHVGQTTVPSHRALGAVIAQAYDERFRADQAELNALTAAEPQLRAEIERMQKSVEADVAAMEARAAELREQLAETRVQVERTAEQVDMKAAEVQRIEARTAARREDVLRLKAQIEEIRADQFRLSEIQQQLRDLIQELDGGLDRAGRRERQLQPYFPRTAAAEAAR